MSNTLYLKCDSGMSGDMFLSTMVDLGVPLDYLKARLAKLPMGGYELTFDRIMRNGTLASSVDVELTEPENLWVNPYSGDYRNYAQIKQMISESGLNEREKFLAQKIFHIKSKAESIVHGVEQKDVKFHEAGAVDSVVDVVGAAICVSYFNPTEIVSNSVPTGYGEVHCACGTLSVPAPAVREILSQTGLPHYRSDIPQEVLTPTGAAILAGVVDTFQAELPDEKNVVRTGYGTGTRETGLPPMEAILS